MSAGMLILALMVLCLVLSFLLSGMEAGVFALNRLRVRRLARPAGPSAKLLYGFLEHPENFLWTILVGNTLANFIILGWFIVELHRELLGQHVLVVVRVRGGRVSVLHVFRSAAENVVPGAAQPVLPRRGRCSDSSISCCNRWFC